MALPALSVSPSLLVSLLIVRMFIIVFYSFPIGSLWDTECAPLAISVIYESRTTELRRYDL